MGLRSLWIFFLCEDLNSTRPPLTWSPSPIEKGETKLLLWKPHTGTAGLETGTHAWLARQSGALAIAPRPLRYFFNSFSAGTVFIRQNLTSADVRFWRIKTSPALKGSPQVRSRSCTYRYATENPISKQLICLWWIRDRRIRRYISILLCEAKGSICKLLKWADTTAIKASDSDWQEDCLPRNK